MERAVLKAIALIDEKDRLELLSDPGPTDTIHQLFKKIGGSGEYAREDLYRQFSGLDISVEDKAMVGVGFRLYTLKGGEANARMQELLRFSAANKIQKLMEERGWGFMIKKEISACYGVLLLERGKGDRS